jgi:MFS family permease
MIAGASAFDHSDDRMARRNALVLAAAQAIGGASAPIVISMGGLVGYYLLGDDKSLATLPVTAFVLGVASGTIPAAMLMRRIGRRPGFQLGALTTMVAGGLAGYAVIIGSFWLVCLGTAFAGLGNAFVQQYRFAAADTATPAFRPKAISWVLAGGVVTGVLGPQIVILTKDALDPIPFAGAFLTQIVLGLAAILVLAFLRIPKLPPAPKGMGGRPLLEIARQGRFIVAVVCAIGSYGLMSLVMTAAPLAMVACDHTQTEATLGIQWHVIAMFAPSFFTGALIVRFGTLSVIAAGLVLLAASAAIALSGITVWHFWIALVLLGIGWNFGFIGATALLTETYEPAERSRVQAMNDFLVFGFQALASLMSGAILVTGGWEIINVAVFPVAGVCLLLLGWLKVSLDRGPAV